ncbi:MAG: FkbM family methyltransferase [Syntrophorhabdaceae bacterium]|nr:FkbM family methyltransferase [Syntrophorhabdaceae bacterium]
MKKTLGEKIREQFSRLAILRPIIDDVDLERTAIVTFTRTLEEALHYYAQKIRKASSPPHFILADWHGTDRKKMENEIAANHRVHIFTLAEHILGDKRPLCVYTSPPTNPMDWWKDFHFNHMVRLLRSQGVFVCGIDAAAVQSRPQRQALPGYFEDHIAEICSIYAGLANAESRETFLRAVKVRVTGNAGWLPLAEYGKYHHPLVSPGLGDVVCVGGLLAGRSASAQAWCVGPGGRVYGFEPEPTNAAVSQRNLRFFPNVTVENFGLWSTKATLHIENKYSSSTIQEQASSCSQECRTVTLDEYLADRGKHCDLISLDVENAEMQVLQGAIQTIHQHRPKLQISIYHSDEQFLQIPLMLMRENLGYSFYIGCHSAWYTETTLYATTSATI